MRCALGWCQALRVCCAPASPAQQQALSSARVSRVARARQGTGDDHARDAAALLEAGAVSDEHMTKARVLPPPKKK